MLILLISQQRSILHFFTMVSSHSLSINRLLAKLDKADRALCFTSGMAALSAVTHLVATGTWYYFLITSNSKIVLPLNVSEIFFFILFCGRWGDYCWWWHVWWFWSPTVTSNSKIGSRGQVSINYFLELNFFFQLFDWSLRYTWCRRVDTTNLKEVASAISHRTKLVWLESPTNPRQQISDIRVSSFKLRIRVTRLWHSPDRDPENSRACTRSRRPRVGGQQHHVSRTISTYRARSR